MPTTSLGGARYFLTFIDDYSRKVWIYPLREKSQKFAVFKQFKELVERQTGLKLKVVRSNNGGEYTSKKFNQYCKDHGIQRQLTVAYTPQQNGMVERMNRTLVEKAKTMMIGRNVPDYLWCEAVCAATYLTNRSPTSTILGKTPEEAWARKKPTISHLKVFGCTTYMHTPKENCQKFDDKSS
eukprot:Gb_15908 [translate_table: standard]